MFFFKSDFTIDFLTNNHKIYYGITKQQQLVAKSKLIQNLNTLLALLNLWTTLN